MFSETYLSSAKSKRRIPLWRKVAAGLVAIPTVLGFYLLSAGTVVMNGTSSLPHNGYAMVSWPIVPFRGAYVAFHAPKAVDDRFAQFSFVKQIVGMPGDFIAASQDTVCVKSECRSLLPELIEAGQTPLRSGIIPDDFFLVFGKSPDSLDSRYAVVGLIPKEQIQAVGVAAPLPHWKRVRAWLDS